MQIANHRNPSIVSNPASQDLRCFSIYYLNFSKVYEISMMIDNVVVSSILRENATLGQRNRSVTISLSNGTGASSRMYLADVKSLIGVGSSDTNTRSSKMIESLDVKTTKSILLRRIVEKCIMPTKIASLNEGDLVKLDNIQLTIFNEDNLRQILALRREALKGFRIEGIELNNMISAILQDYSYILYGRTSDDQEILIKIPMDIDSEFESKYSVDDLLVGRVSVIGVYKGAVTQEFVTSNTFNYLSTLSDQQADREGKVFPSSRVPMTQSPTSSPSPGKIYSYIDVIAIIQDVAFEAEQIEPKRSWFDRLKRRILPGY